ncbi:TlpA family protein disulfide reductase [Pedobacter hiemivivus]|uniref:Redoxin domain-containing protein n=1 Tax=Pedobacter hiemivivus TaxID=2530454 RepID=A0A4R0NDK2_9SPHI|nr:redoxin family protein [Pedobacter hiemivivus]TCC98469.1 redoxin domain-containing protein [Pedobacter hiemivivus]
MKDKLKQITCKLILLGAYGLLCFVSISSAKAIQTFQNERKKAIYINVRYKEAISTDTLIISINGLFLTEPWVAEHGCKATADPDGFFRFEIPTETSCGYFTLSKPARGDRKGHLVYMLKNQLYESGDSLDLEISFTENAIGQQSNSYNYHGKGAQKYNLVNMLISGNFKPDPQIPITITGNYPQDWDGNILSFPNFDAVPTLVQQKVDFLDRHKYLLSPLSYQVIRADLLYSSRGSVFEKINAFVKNGKMQRQDELQRRKIRSRFASSFDYLNTFEISPEALAISVNYTSFLAGRFGKLRAQSSVDTGFYSLEYVYKLAKNYSSNPALNEKLVMLSFTTPEKTPQNIDSLYADAEKYLKIPDHLALLKSFRNRTSANSFSTYALTDTGGKHVKTTDFKDKIVLIDLWFTGCSGCAAYYQQTLSKVKVFFKDNPSVVFLSVCSDLSQETWKKSILTNRYTSSDAVNLYTNGLGLKHPFLTSYNIVSAPTVILLDQTGKIKYFNTSNLYKEELLKKTITELL